MISTHDKIFKSEAKRAFRILGNIEYFLDNIREFIKDYKPIKVEYKRIPPANNDRIDVAFSDIHIGKR